MPIAVVQSIQQIPAHTWDGLCDSPQPFLRHAFLSALEDSASVGGRSGWQPAHGVLADAQGQVLAAMPGYVKSHSYGEYVFDHAWADACSRAGIDYYPKLLAAIPFSPVSGPRFLGAPAADRKSVQ